MNMEKVKQAYKENSMLRGILKEFFTEEELTSSVTVEEKKNKVTQESFNKAFNEIIEGSTQRYLDPETGRVSKKKTSRIEVLDSNDKWLIDYDTNPEDSYFWYQYDRVHVILRDKFSLQFKEIQRLMKRMVETQFKMKDTILGLDMGRALKNG